MQATSTKYESQSTPLEYLKLKVGDRNIDLTPINPEKFTSDDPKAAEFLEEHGYVVFKDVASKQEVAELMEMFWEHLTIESNGRMKRDDMSTWQNYAWQGYTKAGINGDHGLPHSKFVWKARAIPNIRKLYSTIWNTDDLIVSFDAVGAFRPPEYDERWKTQRGWFHVDQNGYVKKGRHAVQGLLNLIPNGSEDGGLVVVPKSVHAFETLFKNHKNLCELYGPDYAELNGNNIKEIWEAGLQPVKINLDVGDFVCWDSRTTHCNHPAKELPLNEGAYLRRLVAYICMTPTSSVTGKHLESLIQNRIDMFKGGYGGTHWPHDMHDASCGGYAYYKGNTPSLNIQQWELLVGKEASTKLQIPEKGNEDENEENY